MWSLNASRLPAALNASAVPKASAASAVPPMIQAAIRAPGAPLGDAELPRARPRRWGRRAGSAPPGEGWLASRAVAGGSGRPAACGTSTNASCSRFPADDRDRLVQRLVSGSANLHLDRPFIEAERRAERGSCRPASCSTEPPPSAGETVRASSPIFAAAASSWRFRVDSVPAIHGWSRTGQGLGEVALGRHVVSELELAQPQLGRCPRIAPTSRKPARTAPAPGSFGPVRATELPRE